MCPLAASARTAVPRPEVAAAVDGLARYASVRGLAPDVLAVLIESLTCTPFHLDRTLAGRIVARTLLPRRKVSEALVLRIVAALGSGPAKPPLPVQV